MVPLNFSGKGDIESLLEGVYKVTFPLKQTRGRGDSQTEWSLE